MVFCLGALQTVPGRLLRATALIGDALGHSWVGLLLLRAMDPRLQTPVPLAFSYKMMMFFVPASGGKNAIVIGKFYEDHGPSLYHPFSFPDGFVSSSSSSRRFFRSFHKALFSCLRKKEVVTLDQVEPFLFHAFFLCSCVRWCFCV